MKTMLGLVMLTLPLLCVADVVVPVDSVESYVNIRKSPEAGTEVVGRLQKGEPLKLVESVPGWNQVELADGGTGFVSADWSTVIVDEATESEAVADVVDEATESEAVADVVDEVTEEVAEAVEAVAEAVEDTEAEPEPVVEAEPEPVAEAEPEPVAQPEPAPEPVDPVVEEPEDTAAACRCDRSCRPGRTARTSGPTGADGAARTNGTAGEQQCSGCGRNRLDRGHTGIPGQIQRNQRRYRLAGLRQRQSDRYWHERAEAAARGERQHPDS